MMFALHSADFVHCTVLYEVLVAKDPAPPISAPLLPRYPALLYPQENPRVKMLRDPQLCT